MRTFILSVGFLCFAAPLFADSLEESLPAVKLSSGGAPSAKAQPTVTSSKADAILAQAREDLRVSEQAERQVRERLQELAVRPGSDPELIKQYAEYLQRLEALSAAQRSKLAELETVYASHASQEEEHAAAPLVLDEDEKWQAPTEPVIEEGSLEALEREFNSSLNEFDDFLLREQDMLHTEMDHIASRANAAIEQLTSKAKESAEVLKNQGEKPPPAVSEKPSPTEKEGGEKPPEDVRGDPASDDVVARQLREAAENERDPALREKLWAEYDAYKEGLSE
jgi:hypothetical protein